MQKLDRQTRNIMKKNLSINRLYLLRSEGGLGVTKGEEVSAAIYLLRSKDPQVKGAMVLQHRLSEMGLKSFLEMAHYVDEKYSLDITIASPFNLEQPVAHVVKDLKEEQSETL